jgi:outer membrane biosynthesis protein TonB
VAKNEDGEFELVLGNNQLLSVFVLMVLLLVVCFVGGYFLGRKATPVLNAAATANGAPVEVTHESEPTKIVDATKPEPKSSETPIRTAPQSEPETKAEPKKEEPKQVAKVEPPKPEPAKPAPKKEEPKQLVKADTKAKVPEPVKAKPELPKLDTKGKQATAAGQPIPGRIYLQLSATEKDKADAMVDLLRRSNLPGFAAAIPDRPGLFRVLVGPLAETGIADMKAQLKRGGFPADEAIRRQF